ncbi:MAG TPA: ABC transporter substrate-binding protein [Burkholderiales bacterium]|nr:ABC transporter substrate-binding protein [Burkholderiales bacterium]
MALAEPAKAQRTPRIGVLTSGNPEPLRTLLQQGLRAYGYEHGRSIHIEFRFDEGKSGALPALATELVRLPVDLIVASPTPAVQAAKAATQNIPVLMLSGDPLEAGIVSSLSRPGGNVTGISAATAEVSAKCLEIIKEADPSAKRVAVLANATDPFTKPFLEQIGSAARATGIEIRTIMIDKPDQISDAFSRIGSDFVIVQPSLPRKPIIAHALRHRVRTIAPSAAWTESGGLMSYAGNIEEMYRTLAGYVDRVLKGAKPGDLPVQLPTKYDLVVNLTTAKAIDFEIPRALLLRAQAIH